MAATLSGQKWREQALISGMLAEGRYAMSLAYAAATRGADAAPEVLILRHPSPLYSIVRTTLTGAAARVRNARCVRDASVGR